MPAGGGYTPYKILWFSEPINSCQITFLLVFLTALLNKLPNNICQTLSNTVHPICFLGKKATQICLPTSTFVWILAYINIFTSSKKVLSMSSFHFLPLIFMNNTIVLYHIFEEARHPISSINLCFTFTCRYFGWRFK